MMRSTPVVLVLGMLIPWLFAGPVWAEVVTDGRCGPQRALSGPDFLVNESLGRRAGANLFHSFQRFSIQQGESTTFTGDADIQRVISRVTGGEASVIDGLIRSQVGNADLYFINPQGVLFGPNARLDLPAGFHVSTATELRFPDGAVFGALPAAASTLSLESPSAYGFRDAAPGAITIEGSLLELRPGQAFSLTAGEIGIGRAVVAAPEGQLRLLALGDGAAPEVALDGALPTAAGAIEVSDSTLWLPGEGGGRAELAGGAIHFGNSLLRLDNTGTRAATNPLEVQAASLRLDNNALWTIDSEGSGKGGHSRIRVAGAMTIGADSAIGGNSLGGGDAGTLEIQAGSLTIDGRGADDFTGIAANTYLEGGSGGRISIQTGALELLAGAAIAASSWSAGSAGEIAIAADQLRVDGAEGGFTGIAATAEQDSTGAAGRIDLQIAGRTELLNRGQVSASSWSSGAAGDIRFRAGSARFEGDGSGAFTGIVSHSYSDQASPGGKVAVTVEGPLELLNGGRVSSATWSAGDAGRVEVTAGALTLNDFATPGQYTGIGSDAGPGASGNAGEVQVTVAGRLSIGPGAVISSGTFGPGDAGRVWVQAGELAIDAQNGGQFTGISTTAEWGSRGDAGRVEVSVAGGLDLRAGGAIFSNTQGEGNGGSVRIDAGSLRVEGAGSSMFTGIWSDADPLAGGHAGDVAVTVTDRLVLAGDATLTSTTWSGGDAGSVRVAAGSLYIQGSGYGIDKPGIRSEAVSGATGRAGDVTVTVAGLLEMTHSGAISSNTYGPGDAGSVAIQAGQARLDGVDDNGFVVISSGTDGDGDAGAVSLTVADGLEVRNWGFILTSSTAAGDAGDLTISADRIRLAGGVGHSVIGSEAVRGSSGFAGFVNLRAKEIQLSEGGRVGVSSIAVVPEERLQGFIPGRIEVTADRLTLESGASINASSGVVPASDILLRIGDRLWLRNAAITTESNYSDGGSITLDGGAVVVQDSRITTSAYGLGNGGLIHLQPAALLLDSGFIQANTLFGSQGGDLSIDTPIVWRPADQRFVLGGELRQEFIAGSGLNVIQAAAPEGVSGEVRVPPLTLDLGGGLFGLRTDYAGLAGIAADPCTPRQGGESALVRSGRGAPGDELVLQWNGPDTPLGYGWGVYGCGVR